MAADTTPAADQPAPPTADRAEGGARPRDKVRLRFRKLGALRLLSHHDLMRTFERLLRRALVPFHRTQGFHPKPRVVFALSLPLGVVGRDEVVEVELAQPMEPEEVLRRVVREAPPGLEFTRAGRVPPRQTARVCGLSYAVPVPPERLPDLRPRLAEALAAPSCVIERTRPPRRRLDLRPLIRDLRLAEETGPDGRPRTLLVMDLWLTDRGTARPEEVLRTLNLEDLLDAGAVLERLRLELEDEHTERRNEE
jgi:radical SAM-linked protein